MIHCVDRFGLVLTTAGLATGSFGLMVLSARAPGGIASDRVARNRGLDGRARLPPSLFTRISCGAIHPFIDRRAMGEVAGIIGAGGNIGGVAAAFLFKEMAACRTSCLPWAESCWAAPAAQSWCASP